MCREKQLPTFVSGKCVKPEDETSDLLQEEAVAYDGQCLTGLATRMVKKSCIGKCVRLEGRAADLLQGEAVAHDGPSLRGLAILGYGFLCQVAHLHLLLHVPQHSAIHFQALGTCIKINHYEGCIGLFHCFVADFSELIEVWYCCDFSEFSWFWANPGNAQASGGCNVQQQLWVHWYMQCAQSPLSSFPHSTVLYSSNALAHPMRTTSTFRYAHAIAQSHCGH